MTNQEINELLARWEKLMERWSSSTAPPPTKERIPMADLSKMSVREMSNEELVEIGVEGVYVPGVPKENSPLIPIVDIGDEVRAELRSRLNALEWTPTSEPPEVHGPYLVCGRGLIGTEILEYSTADGKYDEPKWLDHDTLEELLAIDYWMCLPTPREDI